MRLARLLFVSALFVGWLGYLGYLVATRPQTPAGRPLVLSRPQLLDSTDDVVAELPSPPGEDEVTATVVEVLHPEDSTLEPGDKIRVSKLELCHPVPRTRDDVPPPDWAGAGRYLLPLKRAPGRPGHYEVAAIPPSPGFTDPGVYRIYPATEEALAQYRKVEK